MSALMAGSGERQRLLAARHPIVKRDERAGAVHEAPRAHGFDIAAGRVARRGLVVGVAPGREAPPLRVLLPRMLARRQGAPAPPGLRRQASAEALLSSAEAHEGGIGARGVHQPLW